jgi:hypothetical protein
MTPGRIEPSDLDRRHHWHVFALFSLLVKGDYPGLDTNLGKCYLFHYEYDKADAPS